MDMTIDETGQEVGSAQIQHLITRFRGSDTLQPLDHVMVDDNCAFGKSASHDVVNFATN